MITLREVIADAKKRAIAVGHFNISNLEGLHAIAEVAKELEVPVIIGVSEGEREFIGLAMVRVMVSSIRETLNHPIFLNADHTYSFEKVKEAIDLGYDSVIFDGSKLSFEENVHQTKACVEYARKTGRDVVVEGELGYIGTSSKVLDEIPADVQKALQSLTTPEEAKRFIDETKIDLFAPAIGNIHGMLRNSPDPHLDIERIKTISATVDVPLVLHGGSGTPEEDFVLAIRAGMSVVHINTELRVAFRKGVEESLKNNPNEVAPYRIMQPAVEAMKQVVMNRLKMFNRL